MIFSWQGESGASMQKVNRLPWLLGALLTVGCATAGPGGGQDTGATMTAGNTSQIDARREMVESQIRARGITTDRVLAAMLAVPRHQFVPRELQPLAYADRPLPIGEGQTISQPYIVALMTDLADISPGDNVLEVGTGSGYQAAVLAQMGVHVRTIEIIESLSRRARALLEQLGYDRVEFRTGDGYAGWPEAAPFDAIVVTAAPDHVPGPLRDQLALGGRLVIPVGRSLQNLLVITRTEEGFREEEVIPVRFVPMTGKAQEP